MVAVTVEPDTTAPAFNYRSQEVDYRVREKVGDSFNLPSKDHEVTLSEKFTEDSPNKGKDIKISDPPKSQKNTFEDTQGVNKGKNFSVERHWTVDGKPTQIFYEGTKGSNGKPLSARSEVLKLSYEKGFDLSRRDTP